MGLHLPNSLHLIAFFQYSRKTCFGILQYSCHYETLKIPICIFCPIEWYWCFTRNSTCYPLLYTYVSNSDQVSKLAENIKITEKWILYRTSKPSNSFELTPSQTLHINLLMLQIRNREERSTSLGKDHTRSNQRLHIAPNSAQQCPTA